MHRAQTRVKDETTMRFMMIYKPADTAGMEAGTPPTQDEMNRMGAFIDEMARTGALIATDGLLPTSLGAKVRQSDGDVTVTDGPFTEAKEIIGGFAIMEFPSLADAIAMTKRFLVVAGDGETEIRQMYDQPAYARA